jgi:hypothetical protein
MKLLPRHLALLLFASLPLYAADLSDLTWTTTNGEVTITDCDEAATGELIIPDTIEGNPVTSIGNSAFLGCSSLTSITIGSSVTSIGEAAFYNCAILTSITIPDSVTSIGGGAFYNCRSLTSITIGDSVTSIGPVAFYDCIGLARITIPDSVTNIGSSAFFGCPAAIEIRPVTQNQLAAQLATVTTERDAAIAERDARPTADQLAAVEAERDARPTADQLAAAEAERDARPTAEELSTVQAERDAILGDIQLAYDEVNAATGEAAEEDLVAVAPTSSATIFDLVWTNSEDPTDTIEMTIEFPEGTIANPVEFGFDTTIQGSVLTIDYQGTVTVINDASIAFESPVVLDFSQELMGQNGFGATAGSPGSGDFNLFGAEVPEGTFSGRNYFTLGAPDRSLYTLTSMLAPITSRFSSLELNPLTELYSSLVATNEEAIAARDAAIAERDARPTTEELAAVEAERDARFTEDQIRALSADYTIGLNEAGNVQMKFNLFESADLATFAPLTLNPDSVSVVDGSICLEFAPEDRAVFFRFSVE